MATPPTNVCLYCSTELPPRPAGRPGPRRRFCSAGCKQAAYRDRRPRPLEPALAFAYELPALPLLCLTCHAVLAHRAGKGRPRRYCSDACKVAARREKNAAKRALKPPPPLRACPVCGKDHDHRGKQGNKLRTCSKECAARVVRLTPRTAATCPICGDQFDAAPQQKYCNPRCLYRAANRRRGRGCHRARNSGAERDRYDDLFVFERDGWRCHICGRKIRKNLKWPHPWSASIDHLIPCGPRDAGPDVLANVRAAHLQCNLKKGRRSANDQLMLVGHV